MLCSFKVATAPRVGDLQTGAVFRVLDLLSIDTTDHDRVVLDHAHLHLDDRTTVGFTIVTADLAPDRQVDLHTVKIR